MSIEVLRMRREVMMKLASLVLLTISVSLVLAGCNKNAGSADPDAGIRAAIQAHLAHKGTLNLQAFDMTLQKVTIQGEHAQAQVTYSVKNGPGSMQLTYALEKRDGNWAVVESDPVGSNFSHPSLDSAQNPAGPGATDNVGRSISDMMRSMKSGDAGGAQALPPGHPPVNGAPAAGAR
jgi:hypothetical protein